MLRELANIARTFLNSHCNWERLLKTKRQKISLLSLRSPEYLEKYRTVSFSLVSVKL